MQAAVSYQIKYWNLLIWTASHNVQTMFDHKIYYIKYNCNNNNNNHNKKRHIHLYCVCVWMIVTTICNSYISDDDRNHTSLFCLLWRLWNILTSQLNFMSEQVLHPKYFRCMLPSEYSAFSKMQIEIHCNFTFWRVCAIIENRNFTLSYFIR